MAERLTPRSQSSSVTHTVSPNVSDDEEEERPVHTSEIGTLKKLPNSGTAWLGSSSGVYFVNTVRRAFSAAFQDTNALPASEDILTGEDAEGRSYNGPLLQGPLTTDGFPRLFANALGRPPNRKTATELVTSFFKAWHPVFPFLHGPRFIRDMEMIYQHVKPQQKPADITLDLRKLVTFQLIINIASLDRTDIKLTAESRVKSTADVTRVAGSFALDHDLLTLQTLLAAQLYLVATLAIRQASTVGGIIVRLIFHAGLHRCPLRYAQLSLEECEMRKRIFWTAYALDRHCSLSLGDPNTIQDSDIDVCLSGKELHKAVARDLLSNPEKEIDLHYPTPRAGLATGPPSDDPRIAAESEGPAAKEKRLREAALINYVSWSKLTGQIIEIFHKSINHRFPKHEQIAYLTSDIETWWNDLPSCLTNEDPTDSEETAPHLRHLASFFKILYHRLLLLLYRPRLSLDQATSEFQYGLQVCIRASRNIISGLKTHKSKNQSMFLPGLLSAAWMSGLIIAFACQLGKYPKARACADISACLGLVEAMNTRWYSVKNCHKVLSLLLSNIDSRRASTSGYLAINKPEQSTQPHPLQEQRGVASSLQTQSEGAPRMPGGNVKRKRLSDNAMSPPSWRGSPKMLRKEDSDLSSSGRKTRTRLQRGRSGSANTKAISSNEPDASQSVLPASISEVQSGSSSDIQTSKYFDDAVIRPIQTESLVASSVPSTAASLITPKDSTTNPAGSALYLTPQDMYSAKSDMAIPGLNTDDPASSHVATAISNNTSTGTSRAEDPVTNDVFFGLGNEADDPMFWGNIDYNLADIFGSATWENMTGPLGTSISNGGFAEIWGDEGM